MSSYLKIFSRQQLDEDGMNGLLVFDYKCEDEDSIFYPASTYEYFHELGDAQEENENFEETYKVFIENIQFIFGALDSMGTEYTYNILGAEHKDMKHPSYREGFNSPKSA